MYSHDAQCKQSNLMPPFTELEGRPFDMHIVDISGTNTSHVSELQIRNGLISFVLPDFYFNQFFTNKIFVNQLFFLLNTNHDRSFVNDLIMLLLNYCELTSQTPHYQQETKQSSIKSTWVSEVYSLSLAIVFSFVQMKLKQVCRQLSLI